MSSSERISAVPLQRKLPQSPPPSQLSEPRECVLGQPLEQTAEGLTEQTRVFPYVTPLNFHSGRWIRGGANRSRATERVCRCVLKVASCLGLHTHSRDAVYRVLVA
ncbi:hypothetical protein L798_07327 [Zootermopsis nevadensis]|uniref:Uncharacterized protein n=1 Tax=Zootermopsis nevadensis TaxID=136037 RepID=A0A067R6G6_ZOONE|nr:hypothetical protein L798_07327 [Zootermopsis nevadensis]